MNYPGYVIANNRSDLLSGPYLMIGFPEFSNQKWVNGVSSRVEARFPGLGYASFWEEAQAANRAEYTLTRDDDESGTQPLKGLVAIDAFGKTYTLQAEYRRSEEVATVFSAHVNKPDYLTSHLYVLMNDLQPGEQAQVVVRHTLAR